jgi:hypothetical protein
LLATGSGWPRKWPRARGARAPLLEPTDQDPDRTVTHAVVTATSNGQRLRVLRPHARGGLGEVSVAPDVQLNREVALKQILENHADEPASRQRFLLEAEITGGLEHPGIVPVYGPGTYGNGCAYYAMRFVRGLVTAGGRRLLPPPRGTLDRPLRSELERGPGQGLRRAIAGHD